MATCVRCKKEVSGLGSLIGFNKATGRCSSCENQVYKALNTFRNAFIHYGQDGVLSQEEWKELIKFAKESNVEWDEALRYIRGDALHFLERILTFISADGIITAEEEQYFHDLSQYLKLPPDLLRPLSERFDYLKAISNIRQGSLPSAQPSIHLESNELCHLETQTVYYNVRHSSVVPISGRLVATNQKIHFLSQSGGWTIAWKKVMRVECEGKGVYLELSIKKGNGHYDVPDAIYVQAVLNTLARVAKRQLLIPQEDAESRHIPQEVKQAVWQRDQGKCVQCSATSYPEFDHIIPFSKGGASTLNNIQLLCRRCNLEKGDKI